MRDIMHARTGKVRPKITFHGEVTMAGLRRKARQANTNRRIVASLTRQHVAMHQQMREQMRAQYEAALDPSMEDPRIKPPRLH